MKKNFDPFEMARLIFSELTGEITENEKKILEEWKSRDVENTESHRQITDLDRVRKKIRAHDEIDRKKAWRKLKPELVSDKRSRKFNIRPVIKYTAAAAILIFISTYLLLKDSPDKDIEYTDRTGDEYMMIPSGTQKALLTTANNEKIELGNREEKKMIRLNRVMATDTMNTLSFTNLHPEEKSIISKTGLNTLETPRGGEYAIILSDGTRVLLNADTRLIFPEVFAKTKREVILDGEAYFDVAKQNDSPFIVKTSGYQVLVYGTSFNVSSYSADRKSHTTLVEGNVGILMPGRPEINLKPGEQVLFDRTNNSLQKKEVDVSIYTSWKNGEFVFDHESLGEIMVKLERWYNVETRYANKDIAGYHFSGTLNRYDEINKILNMISLTSNINFRVRGHTVEVDLKEQ